MVLSPARRLRRVARSGPDGQLFNQVMIAEGYARE